MTAVWLTSGRDDAGLSHLRGLTTLESLELRRTNITGSGLAHLATLPNLETLALDGTKIADDGLVGLANAKTLRSLNLGETGVSQSALQAFEKALPDCRVTALGPAAGPQGNSPAQGQ